MKDGGAALRNHQDFFVRKDGTRFPVACSSAPIISDGSLAGLVVVFRDVTRQKQAQQELRESERRYRALADSMPQIVWTAKPDGSFDYFNRRWYEYTGFAEERNGDESWLPILHPDDVLRCVDSWHEAVRSGDPYQIEYRFKDRASSGYRWHLGRALPVRDEAGRIERWFGTCTDIDDQKRLEQKVARGQHRQGPVPGDAGPRAAQSPAPLLSTLYVLGQDDAIRRTHGASLGRMERQLRRLNRMVEDLLEASRVVFGRAPLRPERLDLARLVRAVVEDRRPLLERAGVALTLKAPETPVWVQGDADRLAQVLDNLLDNETRFVDRGGRADLELRPTPAPARRC